MGISIRSKNQKLSMKSIFNKAENSEIIERVNKLSSETQPVWGKMDVSQMLAHIHEPLLVMTGDKKLSFTLMGILMGGYLKKKFLRERGFGKNLPTHSEFKMVDKKQFKAEQSKVIALLNLLHEKGPSVVTKNKHPFFGKMTQDEWSDMMYIHMNHHLNQFGV